MLSQTEKDVLAFERSWWEHRASKEDAIARRFGVDATTYYRTLNALLDRADAFAHDPLLVRRLRRQRAARLARRRSA